MSYFASSSSYLNTFLVSAFILAVILIKSNEKRNRKQYRKKEANTIEHNRQEKRTSRFCA